MSFLLFLDRRDLLLDFFFFDDESPLPRLPGVSPTRLGNSIGFCWDGVGDVGAMKLFGLFGEKLSI